MQYCYFLESKSKRRCFINSDSIHNIARYNQSILSSILNMNFKYNTNVIEYVLWDLRISFGRRNDGSDEGSN